MDLNFQNNSFFYQQLYKQIQVYCIIIAIWLILQLLLLLEIVNLKLFLMFKQMMYQKKNLHIENQCQGIKVLIFIDNTPKQMILNRQVILLDHTKDQSDVILQYLPQGQAFMNKTNQSILQTWIPTLPQDERKLIEKNKKNFPIPRNIAYHEIINGLNKLYGQGKNRRLWPGEEALLMETIRLYINKILQNPRLLMHSVAFTLQQIIKISGLNELENYKFCMRQLECHWKMMITRFKYSGNKELSKKHQQHWLELAQLRGHFLNLQNDNVLTQYLLKHQKLD